MAIRLNEVLSIQYSLMVLNMQQTSQRLEDDTGSRKSIGKKFEQVKTKVFTKVSHKIVYDFSKTIPAQTMS